MSRPLYGKYCPRRQKDVSFLLWSFLERKTFAGKGVDRKKIVLGERKRVRGRKRNCEKKMTKKKKKMRLKEESLERWEEGF